MDGNGVTRREFEDLKAEVQQLRRDLREIDREGSMATRSIVQDVKEIRGTQTWIIRGFIAAIGLALIAWVVIQGNSPAG